MLILRYFQCSFYAMTDVVFTPFSLKVLRLASLARPIPSITSERAWLSPLAHLGKRNQLGISPARRSFLTSLRKASLREDRIAFVLPPKELASMHELLQHVFAHRFIAPFAFRKQRSALAIVNNQVDFFLRMRAIIRPPPAPNACRNHIKLARPREFVHVLSAYKLKDRTHVMRSYAISAISF